MAVERKTWHGAAMSNPRAARTDWRSLAAIANTTLVEVQLHTGRTHQIRVHFSALKHPVVGDTLYGAAGNCALRKPCCRRSAAIFFMRPRWASPSPEPANGRSASRVADGASRFPEETFCRSCRAAKPN